MRRREFIAGLGSAAAWPPAARPQQATIPVIGFLHTGNADMVRPGFQRGLGEMGYVEGRNVAVEYRSGRDLHRLADQSGQPRPILS
jgi:putative ABC transport system substrate-binding protein